MTVNAITDTKKGRTGIAPTYLHTTPVKQIKPNFSVHCLFTVSHPALFYILFPFCSET